MKPKLECTLLGLLAVGVCANSLAAADTPLTTVKVANGLSQPLFVVAPPGDRERLFLVEQRSGSTGLIKILNLKTGQLNPQPFLAVDGVSSGNEQGLLGLAFHPEYDKNGLFYVNFTNLSGTTIVRRYEVSNDPNIADPKSAFEIIQVSQPFSNHNGGWIAFGPDGFLYISLGDGGSGNDPGNRAQNVDTLLGKMLRIDVDKDDFPGDPNRNYGIPPTNPFVGKTGADEIWALGLRNAWRCSFDRQTGDLYVADVGQNAREEIDFQPGSSKGGENYGWRCMEGFLCTGLSGCTCNGPELTLPIHEYTHAQGCSVTGGYVYRGNAICDLQGTYFFADFCSARIWTFRYDGQNLTDFRDRTAELQPGGGSIGSITSFGEDAAGELYIIDRAGDVYKMIAKGPQKGDMNDDGKVDFDDIDPFVLALTDPSGYEKQFGFPPERTGDFDCNGVVDFDDIDPFVAALGG